MLKEFKEFAMKGNVVDLAVGVVIGAAFGKIVTSLVNDIIMPFVGWITGGVNFTHLNLLIKPAQGTIPAVTLNYGNFIQSLIDFLIIAFAIFLLIRLINKMRAQAEEPAAVGPSDEVVLLTEIRDSLKK